MPVPSTVVVGCRATVPSAFVYRFRRKSEFCENEGSTVSSSAISLLVWMLVFFPLDFVLVFFSLNVLLLFEQQVLESLRMGEYSDGQSVSIDVLLQLYLVFTLPSRGACRIIFQFVLKKLRTR
jgi:hypothetical protein